MIEKILDVGCGINKIPGSTGIDIDEKSHADIKHDFNVYPFPIEDNSFDKIYAKHIIEHLDDPQGFINELTRILKPGGTLFMETPHFSSYVAYSEVQHKFFFSYFLFINLIRPLPLEIVNYEITFYKTYRMLGIKALANWRPRTYERFWTFMFPAENLKIFLKKVDNNM